MCGLKTQFHKKKYKIKIQKLKNTKIKKYKNTEVQKMLLYYSKDCSLLCFLLPEFGTPYANLQSEVYAK